MASHQRREDDDEDCRVALLNGDVKKEEWQAAAGGGDSCDDKLGRRVWEESRKLWVIVAPAIFSRVVTYGMNVITQAFAGHLGDLELAAISIANTVVVGFNFGLMVRRPSPPFALSPVHVQTIASDHYSVGSFLALPLFSGAAAAFRTQPTVGIGIRF
ncbi:hypothetical protein PR202_gb18832 [Eleusine coracana subsp. coracana]|uniref:Protein DETOXIFICATION n=1 Tax=Eleusine coracana subsp. coracana TaxID=191504 RepID=A0AAV5F4F2_ELECO|nr:hypothetical protein PR202_gb18832 [Eleusine coracana subsp. coracana]